MLHIVALDSAHFQRSEMCHCWQTDLDFPPNDRCCAARALITWRSSCGYMVRHDSVSKLLFVFLDFMICLIDSINNIHVWRKVYSVILKGETAGHTNMVNMFVIKIEYMAFISHINKQTNRLPVIQECRDESHVSASTELFHQITA